MQYTIHQAKTQLSKLIQAAINGEQVIIARGKKPLIRLEVIPGVQPKRRIGGLKNLILKMDEDFNAPLEV